jgi:hypothetical protein
MCLCSDHMNPTANMHIGDQKFGVYGGMYTKAERTWDFEQWPPNDIRQDVGVGHLLHFVSPAGIFELLCL